MKAQKRINLNKQESPFIIAGLGNPGEDYNKTRHNAGFIFLDTLANQLGLKWIDSPKLKCQLIKHGKLILIKPTSYMNNSGQAVHAVMAYYKLLEKKMCLTIKNADFSDRLLIVHDDLDISFGNYKFSTDSRAAGHNGVQSIIDNLKTKNFSRLRIGIKTDLLQHIKVTNFVLKRFSKDEDNELNKNIGNIIDSEFAL